MVWFYVVRSMKSSKVNMWELGFNSPITYKYEIKVEPQNTLKAPHGAQSDENIQKEVLLHNLLLYTKFHTILESQPVAIGFQLLFTYQVP